MRVLVILGSSSSSIATPHQHHHHNRHFKAPFSKLSPFKPLLSPSSSPSSPFSTVHSRSTPPSTVRWDPNKIQLCYLADLASKLARDGKLQDFVMLAESVLVLGVEASQFTSSLSVELVAKGISEYLCDGKVRSVVDFLRKVNELGVPPLKLFDGSAIEFLGRECRRILKRGEVEELVELMEILAGSVSEILVLYIPRL